MRFPCRYCRAAGRGTGYLSTKSCSIVRVRLPRNSNDPVHWLPRRTNRRWQWYQSWFASNWYSCSWYDFGKHRNCLLFHSRINVKFLPLYTLRHVIWRVLEGFCGTVACTIPTLVSTGIQVAAKHAHSVHKSKRRFMVTGTVFCCRPRWNECTGNIITIWSSM